MKVGVVGNPRYPGLKAVLEQLTAQAPGPWHPSLQRVAARAVLGP